MNESRQFCTFRVDRHFLGVEVEQVQEVIRNQSMTPVPLAPSTVSGLINLRGQIVVAIDLRRRLGLPDRAEGREPMIVVVRTDDGPVSLQVDEIGDVLSVDESMFERSPETMRGMARDLIGGTYKLKDRLLLKLDTAKTVRVGTNGRG
jgi:purine-binding chemotaxis protein CheW